MKSFVAAAEAVGLTQPAVSRTVRELEQNLAHELFGRSTRGAELTRRGKDFRKAAETGLLRFWQGTHAVLGDVGAQESIRIGALPNVCSQFLHRIVMSFKADFPHVRRRISPGTNVGLRDALRQGEAELVIGRMSTSEDIRGLVIKALYDEPLIFVVRPAHPLASARATLRQVLEHPPLLPPKGTIIQHEVARYLGGHGVTRLPDLVGTASSDFQRPHIAATDCVAVVPRGVVQAELASGAVVVLGLGRGEFHGPVDLTTNPELIPGAAVELSLQWIRSGHNIPGAV